jgi:predicted enzyme related to lactoylglutathione lyase
MPDGQRQEPGGWNRIVLYVDDIAAQVDRLRSAGVTFLNDIKVGPGGKQVQITDPDGNSIELHEAPS